MSAETFSTLADRILEHARAHRLASISLVFHGGEPLLAGHARLEQYASTLRSTLAEIPSVDLRIHTNGVRLDNEFCAIFDRYDIKVGVSVDGHRAANDLHRKFANGRSSYPFVERALQLLCKDENRHIYAGLLCTVDLANDPIAVYEALRSFTPSRVDFLLPHATWDDPPAFPAEGPFSANPATAYADWLIAVFERWDADGRPMAVRFFDSIESLARGGSSQTESLGHGPADLVVIETDGTFEQVDSLKVVGDGAAATGLDIFRHSLDEVAAHPGVAARRQGLAGLSSTCLSCPVVDICGGGLYTHRFKTGSGFDNPSVYCASLKKLITHVVEAMPAQSDYARAASPGEPATSDPLDDSALADLAAGTLRADTAARLTQAQADLGREVLVQLSRTVDELPGWDLIVQLDEQQPRALDAVLADPFVRRWVQDRLRECLIAAHRPSPAGSKPPRLGHLAGIAAAAAIRAGVGERIEVPVASGLLCLPTLGTLALGTGATSVTVLPTPGGFVVASEGAQYSVRLNTEAGYDPRWRPVVRLQVSDDSGSGRFECALEDDDRFRDSCEEPTACRRARDEVETWRSRFADGWTLILSDHAAYAPGIRASLRTLTPHTAERSDDLVAAESSAFGAIDLALPQDAAAMALALIQGSQRMYMRAVGDFYDLVDPHDHSLHRPPWRTEQCGVSELLLDAYTHAAAADFWRVRGNAGEVRAAERDHAAIEFARSLRVTTAALDLVAASRATTALGDRFLDATRAKIEPWLTR